MNSQSPQTKSDTAWSTIQGQIERVTFYNDENDFTIARLKVPGYHDLVTVKGTLMAPTPGQVLRITGEWINHPQFGEQFQIVRYTTLVPATAAGIEKYLGSGLIKGIGPVMAKRMVDKFGEDTLKAIEEDPGKLLEVEGVGRKRVERIRKAWSDQKEIREVMVFLQGHGVSSTFAAKIFKQYRNQSIDVVKDNPYRLAEDIFGIGFVTADRIAQNLGIEKDSPQRAAAGIIYVLNQLANEGHVYYPHDALLDKSQEMLQVDRAILLQALASLEATNKVFLETVGYEADEAAGDQTAVYLSALHACERSVAARLKILLTAPLLRKRIDADKAVEWVQEQLSLSLADNQVGAVKLAIEHKVMVITGGPGTGKTTIINAVLKIFGRLGIDILLAAPTGRAAKRMTETTGHEARTIHRLLEFSPHKGGFQKNEEQPLTCDLLVVDEASMIDTILMHHLLKAVPLHATVIMVGDVYQLPSVGPGSVLKDIIESAAVPVAYLTEIFRQATGSSIVVNAHLINKGTVPSLETYHGPQSDFYFVEKDEPEDVLRIILELVTGRIQKAFGYDPVEDVQVISPMNRGVVGTRNLNIELQKALNPREDGITRGGRNYRIGDKVMQIRNNYDKDVYNGDIGRITRINAEDQELSVIFDGRPVTYDYSDLDELVLAYAVSVHKSQGSEYPCVVIPLVTQHYVMLQRNLVYTAITRGKKLVVLVGSKRALATAVRNDKTQKRYTNLDTKLRGTSSRVQGAPVQMNPAQ